MEPNVRLIVGLGNPDAKYDGTRHNIGREVIDLIANETKSSFKSSRQAETFSLAVFFDTPLDQPVIFAKLPCYMNESGPALQGLMAKEHIQISQVLILTDDFMIPLGKFRLRSKGSSGGHNGLNSIIGAFGTEEFGRFRIGIGPVPEAQDPADFVLKKFTKEEVKKIKDKFPPVIKQGLSLILSQGYEKAMNFINSVDV